MSKATIVRDAGFREFLEAERLKPVQRNLFTGELETLRVEVPESIPEDETVVDEGISIVKTDDIAQLVISGFGLYLGKKSLEPFAGFLHVDRPGKPSLVLDLVEEFRQPVVDRAVLSALNLGMSIRMENGQLDKASRDLIASRILERLVTAEKHESKEYQIRSILQMQARKLASFLRGGKRYEAFRFRW